MGEPTPPPPYLAQQSGIGRRQWNWSTAPDPNPIHAAKRYHPAWAGDSDFTATRTLCGVRAGLPANDSEGNRVAEFDPDHPQACRRCRALVRAGHEGSPG